MIVNLSDSLLSENLSTFRGMQSRENSLVYFMVNTDPYIKLNFESLNPFFQVIKKLANLHEKNKERPLCYTYSIKARALIHAHLSRIPLNPNTLEVDRRYVIGKCPYLINEQVNCVNQLIMLAYAKRSK